MTKCWGGSWNGWRIWHPHDQKAWSVPARYDSSLDSAVLHFPDHEKKKKKNGNTGLHSFSNRGFLQEGETVKVKGPL